MPPTYIQALQRLKVAVEARRLNHTVKYVITPEGTRLALYGPNGRPRAEGIRVDIPMLLDNFPHSLEWTLDTLHRQLR